MEDYRKLLPGVEISDSFVDRMTQSTQPYQRPGKIINKELLVSETSMNLKPNLIENFDFVTVPKSVWRLLNGWYSCDWCISRLLVKDELIGDSERTCKSKLVLELYPEMNQRF